jgi:hypothetical protein
MLSITLQTNSITFLSGILLQETVFELGHSTVQSIVQDVCKSIIKHLKHEVMPTQAALVASKHSQRAGRDGHGSQHQDRAGSQTGWDPCRPVKYSRSPTERNWDLTETFLSVWTYPFKYTWENFTERWRSATERERGVYYESALKNSPSLITSSCQPS